jgi:hypothetical protein
MGQKKISSFSSSWENKARCNSYLLLAVRQTWNIFIKCRKISLFSSTRLACCNPSTLEARLLVQGQSRLYSEFQASLDNIARPWLQKEKKNTKETKKIRDLYIQYLKYFEEISCIQI